MIILASTALMVSPSFSFDHDIIIIFISQPQIMVKLKASLLRLILSRKMEGWTVDIKINLETLH